VHCQSCIGDFRKEIDAVGGEPLTRVSAPDYCSVGAGLDVEQRRQSLPVPLKSNPPAARSDLSAKAASTWVVGKRFLRAPALSRVQAVVGTLAGIISIGGAAFSVVHAGRATNTGDLVAIVRAPGGRVSVPDATVEVLTTANAVVATLTSDPTGRVEHELPEGVYLVRISHPRYAAEVRRVQVLPRQTVEVRASLRAGSSSPTDHALGNTMSAIKRAFRF
jgi:hypothetical protein